MNATAGGEGTDSLTHIEKVAGADGVAEYQGACFPFKKNFESGVHRMIMAPADASGRASMFVGMTDRGWGSTGPKREGLQRLIWTGRAPFEVKEMRIMPDGFELEYTRDISEAGACIEAIPRLGVGTSLVLRLPGLHPVEGKIVRAAADTFGISFEPQKLKTEEVRRLISRIDIPVPQVLIEARIVEADDEFSRDIGARLGFAHPGPHAWINSGQGSSFGPLPPGTTTCPTGASITCIGNTQINNLNFVNLPAAALNGCRGAN